MDELAHTHIIPAAVAYQTRLADAINSMTQAGIAKTSLKTLTELLKEISGHLNEFKTAVDNMVEERKAANNLSDTKQKAMAYCHKVQVTFDKIRRHADKMEMLIDDDLWTLVKYRELLFVR
jgi:glutamine synthetase